MSGFLAGIWGRVFATVPGTEAHDSRLPETPAVRPADRPNLQRATGGQWQSAAPVQRVLDGVSPVVVSHDLAAHLATHGNPALTGGEPAPGRGMPVLDQSMHVPDDRTHSAWRRTETTAPTAARPGVRTGDGGSGFPAGGAVGSPAPVEVALPGPTVPRPTPSTGTSAPPSHTRAVPAQGVSEPRKGSVQRVTRATAVRSARSPFLSAPPVPAGRRLTAVVAGAEDRSPRVGPVPTDPAHAVLEPSPPRTRGTVGSTSAADPSASPERPVPSAPVTDTPVSTPPVTPPGRDVARVPHAPASAVVQRRASQGDVPETRTGHAVQTALTTHTEQAPPTVHAAPTAHTDLPARSRGSRDAGDEDAGAGELPPTTQPVHTQATGSDAVAPMTAQTVLPHTAAQRSANGDARMPSKPSVPGRRATVAHPTAPGAAPSTLNTPTRGAGSPQSGLGLGAPLRQQQEVTPAQSAGPVQRTPAPGTQVGQTPRSVTPGGAHHLGLGAPLRSRPSTSGASARPDGQDADPVVPASASGPTVQRSALHLPDEPATIPRPARTTGAELSVAAPVLPAPTDKPAAPLHASTPASANRTVRRPAADTRATAPATTSSETPHAKPSHPAPAGPGAAQALRPASPHTVESALTPAERTAHDREQGAVIQRRLPSGAREFGRNHVAVPGREDASASAMPGEARALAPSSESFGTRLERSTSAEAMSADRSPAPGAAPGVAAAGPPQPGRTERVGPEASGSGSHVLPAASGDPGAGRTTTSPAVARTTASSSAAPTTGHVQGSPAAASGRTSPAQPTASLASVQRRGPLHRAGRPTPQTLRPVAAAAMPRVLTVPVQRSHAGTPSPQAISRSTAAPENAVGPGLSGAAGLRLGQGQSRGMDPTVGRPVHPVPLPLVRPRTVTVASERVATSSPPLVVQPFRGQAPRPAPAVGLGGPATPERSRANALAPARGPLPPAPTTTSAGTTAAAPPLPYRGQLAPVRTPATSRQDRAPHRPSPAPATPSRTPRSVAAPSAPATVQRAGQPSRAATPIAPSAGRATSSALPVAPGTAQTPGPLPPAPSDRSLTVQRQGQGQASSAQRSLSAPGPGASTAAGAPGGSGPVLHALPPESLDALARSLLEPLSRLLRSELRGDRERIGRLRDTP
ncbi:hypothetical protein BX257_8655 [Streptomyces sp. 3212.3]|nr:hypothetical protein BX257_8655 [Streptomyces sp. 3212.3]